MFSAAVELLQGDGVVQQYCMETRRRRLYQTIAAVYLVESMVLFLADSHY
jgi:hypothetical protein